MFCFMFRFRRICFWTKRQKVTWPHMWVHYCLWTAQKKQSRRDSPSILSTLEHHQQTAGTTICTKGWFFFFCCCLSQALAVSDHFPVEVNLMGQAVCVWIIRWAMIRFLLNVGGAVSSWTALAHSGKTSTSTCSIIDYMWNKYVKRH